MPQLDPAPWFMILVFTWLVFITILPSKVLTRISPNKPAQQSTQKFKMKFWDWPW